MHTLITLIAMLVCARVCGALALRLGQAPVLGELIGGMLLIRTTDPTIHFLGELGAVLLLFMIGLETPLARLASVGFTPIAVAITGVIAPMALGYGAATLLGFPPSVAIFTGATLTATSAGITARVFNDLGRIHDPESVVILGAAVADDVIGLLVLAMVTTSHGSPLLWLAILAVASAIGSRIAPWILHHRLSLPFAFAMAYAAERAGLAMIVGGFIAGAVLAPHARSLTSELRATSELLVPLFFVAAGAAADLHSIDTLMLVTAFVLLGAAILGKLSAGLAARPPLDRLTIGIGMIPRGEVGLIFIQLGLASGVLSKGLHGALMLVIIATSLITPPLLVGSGHLSRRFAPGGGEDVAAVEPAVLRREEHV